MTDEDTTTENDGYRSLRDRRDRKLYADDWTLADDEDGGRGFRLEDKIDDLSFVRRLVIEMRGEDFTLAYIQKYGFGQPILFRDKYGLGLQVPNDEFDVNSVALLVGPKRVVDVMDVSTQKNLQMTVGEWVKYYQDPQKERLLNVISLEFSHTRMTKFVDSPIIVKQIDWVETAWPSYYREAQEEGTNAIDRMMYPKVQKYCLMSVKGCYTDFHIDFGGTSVWYHIVKGHKIFWLIPPTEVNLVKYENWILSGKQSDIFFGDTVEQCSRIHLVAGQTFFIPSGWIHAVYTPEDSLVFGGNFLHSFAMQMQIRVAQIEISTKVPKKFRYPFFTEMHWYVLNKYIWSLLKKNHLDIREEEADVVFEGHGHVHMTECELFGLREICLYFTSLPNSKKEIPSSIPDPIALLNDLKILFSQHEDDDYDKAVTGRYILTGLDDDDVRPRDHLSVYRQEIRQNHIYMNGNVNGAYLDPKIRSLKNNGPRRRRTRCKKCEACQRSDCGECSFCLDMVKFGGPGRAKQTCVMRQCLQPMLPVTAACAMCGLDGWGQQPVIPIQKTPRDTPSSLMECSVCYEIAHPDCYLRSCPGVDGIHNDDLPNSWECPRCCKAGKNREYRPRHFRARQKSNEVRRMSLNSDPMYDKCYLEVDSDSQDSDYGSYSPDVKRVKMDYTRIKEEQERAMRIKDDQDRSLRLKEDLDGVIRYREEADGRVARFKEESDGRLTRIKEDLDGRRFNDLEVRLNRLRDEEFRPIRYRRGPDGRPVKFREDPVRFMEYYSNRNFSYSDDSGDYDDDSLKDEEPDELKKLALRTTLGPLFNRGMKRPMYVVRPAARPISNHDGNPLMERSVMVPIFHYLTPKELVDCALVCRAWARFSLDPSLWRRMDLSHKRMTASHLAGIARRQPEVLILDWSHIAKKQLKWLISRLPQLRGLSVQGCPWSGISALGTCVCPPLHFLDLSFVGGLNDSSLRDILSPPIDSRPGLTDGRARLRNLRCLKIAGCDVSDVSMRYVTQHLPKLAVLDISSCTRITDTGIAQLVTDGAPTVETLTFVNVSNLRSLTDLSLEHLGKCQNLIRINVCHTPNITWSALEKFRTEHEDIEIMGREDVKQP